jgi:hypothetical protein
MIASNPQYLEDTEFLKWGVDEGGGGLMPPRGQIIKLRNWDESDEESWEQGVIHCRFIGPNDPRRLRPWLTTSLPPEWCLYAAEHVVLSKEEL